MSAIDEKVDKALTEMKASVDGVVGDAISLIEEGRAIQLRVVEQATRLADNVELIAVGIAKLTERCFCGHRLDLHFAPGALEPSKCAGADCQCEAFLPTHLAIARILNMLTMEVGEFKTIIATVAGLAQPADPDGPRIVSPFRM